DASRLFDFDASRFVPEPAAPFAFGDGPTFTEGVFGRAIALRQQFVELPIGAQPASKPAAEGAPKPGDAPAAADGELGAMLADADKGAETAAPEKAEPAKMTEGTLEFWFQPQWSATDYAFAQTTRRLELVEMPPLRMHYYMDPDNQ